MAPVEGIVNQDVQDAEVLRALSIAEGGGQGLDESGAADGSEAIHGGDCSKARHGPDAERMPAGIAALQVAGSHVDDLVAGKSRSERQVQSQDQVVTAGAHGRARAGDGTLAIRYGPGRAE